MKPLSLSEIGRTTWSAETLRLDEAARAEILPKEQAKIEKQESGTVNSVTYKNLTLQIVTEEYDLKSGAIRRLRGPLVIGTVQYAGEKRRRGITFTGDETPEKVLEAIFRLIQSLDFTPIVDK